MSELKRQKEFSGRDARQGEIVLRTPMRKAIFIAGLAGCVLLAVLLAVSACVPTP
ncbi:MAG: peptide ABC transporter permease [Neoaquamicrobium sediminum]|uniref:Peptide ABC transporter permease n=1 Tax=Neoaquamicrobium sediminum TaxID=1849104 RepID=A0ABV3WMM2_9HYPH|nr:peptide ABC transporter permease [Mesorhizobium sediminum]NRC53739.1 peptide ABC transporter permease [Mesorhizobium sediminum]